MRGSRLGRIAFVFACMGALLVGLLSQGASAATNSRGSTARDTFSFSIGPGGSYFNANDLACIAPCDFDQYNMTITATTSVHISILDCCILGDNICLAVGTRVIDCAISPDSVEVDTPMLSPGTYSFRIGYRPPTPGGFPAGYDMSVTA